MDRLKVSLLFQSAEIFLARRASDRPNGKPNGGLQTSDPSPRPYQIKGYKINRRES